MSELPVRRVAANSELPPEEAFWRSLTTTTTSGSRRRSPRVHANIAVTVKPNGASIIEARSNDVSFHGMQIRCSRDDTFVLQALAQQGSEQAPTLFPVTLHLDVEGLTLRVGADARIAHISIDPNATNEAEAAIGFAFERYEDGTKHALYRFVVEQMRPEP